MSEKPMVKKDMADEDMAAANGKTGADDDLSANAPPEDFAATLGRLEALVERLESGELSLEASLGAFEQSIRLTRDAQHRLDEAELKVRTLTERADGRLADAPFPPEEPSQ